METKRSSASTRHRSRKSPRWDFSISDAFTLDEIQSRVPRFGFFESEYLNEFKQRALDILANYGVVISHPRASIYLKEAGARPGRDAQRLCFPQELVERALRATPKQVQLCGKNTSRDITLPRPDGGFIMRTGTGAHGYIDPATSQYRNMDLTAVSEIAAIANGLDEVGFIAHPFVHDAPTQTADIHSLAALIARTDKHVLIQPYCEESIEYLFRIAAAAAGGKEALKQRPLASCITTSFTPLEFKSMDTEAIILAGQYGLPVHACSLPSAGGTAPLSTPGMVLMAAAEILSMVAIAHVLSPQTPVIATPLMFTLDMRTGRALQSCVESLQAASIAVQLMKEGFGLLTHTYGAGSDTPDVDVQSMAERSLLGQTVALSGADILGGVGQLECATVFSPVQAVLDNEIGAMLRRFIRPPRLDDESFDWNEISSIRAGGHFLDSPHTLKYCRDQKIPRAFLRDDRDSYEAKGRRTAFEQARDIALTLIRSAPEQGYLGDDANLAIAQIIIEADRSLTGLAA